jgi:hypothetical protein
MYKTLLNCFAALLLLVTTGYAQTAPSMDDLHQFKQAARITRCNVIGSTTSAAGTTLGTADVPASSQFHIVGSTSAGNYIIAFLRWSVPDNPTKNAAAKAYKDGLNTTFYVNGSERQYFLLTPAEYTLYAEKVEPRGKFVAYASTTLVKVRPGNKEGKNGYPIYYDFTNDVNLGLMFGYRFSPNPKKDLSFNALLGFGISSIPVDSLSTQGVIKSKGNQAALSPSLGGVVQLNKFQFGVTVGLDLMAGEAGRSWVYKRRPWIGIGIGYSLFRLSGGGSDEQ